MVIVKDKTPKKRTRAKKSDPAKDFEKLSEKFKDKKPILYRMSRSFNNYDVINHKTFGKGIVIDTFYRKMEVVFSEGTRILVTDRN